MNNHNYVFTNLQPKKEEITGKKNFFLTFFNESIYKVVM